MMPRGRLLGYENAMVGMLGVTLGVVFLDRYSINTLMPFMLKDLRLNNAQIGLASSALALSWALSQMTIGRISDVLGRRKPFLVSAVLIFSLCSFATGLATSFATLLAARLFMGLSEGPVPGMSLAITAEASSERRRGVNGSVLVNVMPALIGIGAPALLIGVTQAWGWRQAFFVAGAPGLVMTLVLLLFLREPSRSSPAASSEGTAPAGSAAPSILSILRVRNIRICALIMTLLLAVGGIMNAFAPLYLIKVRHFTPLQLAGILSVMGLCAVLGGPLLPAVSDRIGRKPALIFGLWFSMTGIVGILFFHGPIWALAAILGLSFLGGGVGSLLVLTVPTESLPRGGFGTAIGLIAGVGEIVGSFGAPPLAGWLADRTSLAAPLLVAVGLGICGGFAALLLEETAPARLRPPAAQTLPSQDIAA